MTNVVEQISQQKSVHEMGQDIIREISFRMYLCLSSMRAGTLNDEQVFVLGKFIAILSKAMSGKVGAKIREAHKRTFSDYRNSYKDIEVSAEKPLVLPEELMYRIELLVSTYDKLLTERVVTPFEVANAAIEFNSVLEKHYQKRQEAEGKPSVH